MAIVHHRDSHRHLAWRPIPQPRQMGSLEGGCYRAGEVLRKSTMGNYGERVSRTTQKTAHRAPYLPHTLFGMCFLHFPTSLRVVELHCSYLGYCSAQWMPCFILFHGWLLSGL